MAVQHAICVATCALFELLHVCGRESAGNHHGGGLRRGTRVRRIALHLQRGQLLQSRLRLVRVLPHRLGIALRRVGQRARRLQLVLQRFERGAHDAAAAAAAAVVCARAIVAQTRILGNTTHAARALLHLVRRSLREIRRAQAAPRAGRGRFPILGGGQRGLRGARSDGRQGGRGGGAARRRECDARGTGLVRREKLLAETKVERKKSSRDHGYVWGKFQKVRKLAHELEIEKAREEILRTHTTCVGAGASGMNKEALAACS